MKNAAWFVALLFYSNSFFGQALAHYGNQTITRDEFLRAFRKNNAKTKVTDKAYRDYLNLYIRYRLKVLAAYELKMDTLAQQKTELTNFKSQIIDQYMNDEASLDMLAKEAFSRSQQDLKISYIFIGVPKNATPDDTLKAWNKISGALKELKAGAAFGEIARRYSEDPFAKSNHGELNYITVFDLPYAMESVAYRTPVGKLSPIFRTEAGYMLLQKTDQRPAAGRIRAAQILLSFPYQPTDASKSETRTRADSLFRAIQRGADFSELARKFSGDNLSYQLGGSLPEFGIGKYEYGFETAAYGLKHDGDISFPYESSYGVHIIKRISRIPVSTVADEKTLHDLKEKIKGDTRIGVSRQQMLQTIYRRTGMKENIPAGNALWSYTDSLLQNKKPTASSGISDQMVLFQFPEKQYSVKDWIIYRRSLIANSAATHNKSNSELLDGYRQLVAFQYYKDHLEIYNDDYAEQVADFREGNLLFEIMQKKVWNQASADSAGLKKYFEAHEQNYWWKPGAEAIIFNVADNTIEDRLESGIEKNAGSWRRVADSLGVQVQADSGRFELAQLPGGVLVEAGKFTQRKVNPDKSIQFAYIIREYTSPSARSFEEARGLAINDYQAELENDWVDSLTKKYPVVIDEQVFKSLPKK